MAFDYAVFAQFLSLEVAALLESLRFQSMRRAYLVTTTSLWLPLQTNMPTPTSCSFETF